MTRLDPIANVVVISDKPLSNFMSKNDFNATANDLGNVKLAQSALSGGGFTEVDRQDTVYFFPPSTFSPLATSKAISLYSHIGGVIKPDGTVDLGGDKEGVAYVVGRIQAHGQAVRPDACIVVCPRRTYDLSSGGKRIQITAISFPSPENYQRMHASSLLPIGVTEKPSAWHDDLAVSRPRQLFVSSFGAIATDERATWGAFRAGVGVLDGLFEDEEKKRASAYTLFCSKALGYSISDYFGKSFSDLPSSVQAALRGEAYRSFKQFGYGSFEEFRKVIEASTLTGSRTTLFLDYFAEDTAGKGPVWYFYYLDL